MTLGDGFGEGVGDARSCPDQGGLFNADFFRNLVSRQKPDALDVPGKTIWVFADQGNCVGTVGFVNANRP